MPNNFETAKQQQMQQRTTHGEIKIEYIFHKNTEISILTMKKKQQG
jgi:hypothetical protein